MWNPACEDRQSRKSESSASEAQVDSGFLSCSGEVGSMRGSGNPAAELSRSLLRSLNLKHTQLNNLETSRTLQHQQQQQHQLHHQQQQPQPQQQHQPQQQQQQPQPQPQPQPQQPSFQQMQPRRPEPMFYQPSTMSRLNVKWSEVQRIDILKQSYDFFFKQDSNGDTQLHISIVMSHLEASLWLIGIAPHPCLLDIANDESQSALHLAVMSREARIVRRLVLGGASTKMRTLAGNTPLHLACALGDLACAKALTAPLSQLERNWLMHNTEVQVVPTLCQNLELRNYVGKTSLHIAASQGNVELVNQLVQMGADVDAQEGLAGKTALHLAIENGCRQVVYYLVQERHSCLNAVTYAGDTAYQIALDVDRQLAEELLRFGASPTIHRMDSCSDSSSDNSSEDEREVY